MDNLRKKFLNCDIVIVDNNSPNDSYTVLSKRYLSMGNVFVINSGKNGGYSYGNNVGFRWAENKGYEYYCVMNPDILIMDEFYFDKLIDVLNSDSNVGVVSGLQIYTNRVFGRFLNYWNRPKLLSGIIDHSFLDYFIKKYPKDLQAIKNYAYVEVVSGCCFLTKAELIKQVDYLDEGVFLYYEENILSSKLDKIGKREAVCLDAYFYHNHIGANKETRKIVKEKWIQTESRKYYYKTYVTSDILLNCLHSLFSIIDLCATVLINLIFRGIKNANKREKK